LELNKVEDKLNNALIILKERKVHLRELKKDRDQALKFKELKDCIDSNKATYLHLQITEKEKSKSKYDTEIEKVQSKVGVSEEKITQLKEKIESYKSKISDINKEIEQKGEKEQLKVHREIEDLKVDLTKDKARISTLKDEINKIMQRKDQLKLDFKELEEKTSSYSNKEKDIKKELITKNREYQGFEHNIALFKKKHKIESSVEFEKEIEDKDKLIDQKQEEVQSVRQKQQELLREKDRLEYQIGSLDERIQKVKEIEKENKHQIKDLQQKKTNFKSATLRLNQCLDQDSGFASQISNARKKFIDLQEKQAQLNAKTLSIRAGISGNKAVSAIIQNKSQFKGVHGTISELGQVQKKFARALETAAGARMQHLVVDNDQIAADCIKFLKSNKLGSASFIPLNKIRYKEISSEDKKLLSSSGVHDFALNLISFNSKYKKAFSYVFGNTLVVEDIDSARKVGVGKIKMSTLDGNSMEASGVMRGGFVFNRNALGFKEKGSLEALEKLDGEMSELQGIISNVENKREANEKEISSLRNLKGELEAEIIKLEKTLHLDNADLDATNENKKEFVSRLKEVDNELSIIQRNISLINRDLANFKSKKQTLRLQVNELRNPRLLAQLSAYEESKQKCKEKILRLEGDLKNSSEQVVQLIAPESEKIKEIIKQHNKEEEQFNKETKGLSITISQKEKDLSVKEKESKEFYSMYKGLFNQREKLSSEMNTSDNEIENLREKSRSSEREINLVSLKNAEIKAKLAALNEDFSRYKNAELIKGKSIEDLKVEINRFEVMMAQMSTVNMKALEIYEEVEREYNSLVEKRDGLGKEKTEVLTLMNEIETKKKDHFMKTFTVANENFRKIFSNLFKKGNAYLQLENSDNPFEAGLSIKVKLTGKRFMDIKSLSGGEKTLTALSFIFAIQEYQPASFYILDEIDAALDKHNSDTLARLISDYSGKAQYIVISHNDSIISEADTLYGVSMNEYGISKITSLKI